MTHHLRSAWELARRFRLHNWSQWKPDRPELRDPVSETTTCSWCGKTKTRTHWDHIPRRDR